MKCSYCGGSLKRNGKQSNGAQKYKCSECLKSQLKEYSNKACAPGVNEFIISHLKEGCGIRSIARLSGVSPTTIMKRIIKIANSIKRPVIAMEKEFEVDELCTYIGKKTRRRWICYAFQKDSGKVVSFTVGSRSRGQINQVITTLRNSRAKKIFTDGFAVYKSLIPKAVHFINKRKINHIERNNLTLRTHLKRIQRRTICYSRSLIMLSACLTIFF